jgi:hypothetical protein
MSVTITILSSGICRHVLWDCHHRFGRTYCLHLQGINHFLPCKDSLQATLLDLGSRDAVKNGIFKEQLDGFLLVLILKMEAMSSSKMSVIAYQTEWRSIPEDGTLRVIYFPSCMFVTPQTCTQNRFNPTE